MPDEQMRPSAPRYPVDRYLVESSKQFEMVSITDDEIWHPEPALRPEDEIILRKLHEMLQSTADDLKLLSGELSKYHESGVQLKTAPTPLDEDFNEKVHIEEVVNAKFHGYKIVEKPVSAPEVKLRNDTIDGLHTNRTAKINNSDVGKPAPMSKRPVTNRNLGISRTRIMQINGENQNRVNEKLNNGKVVNNAPAVAYKEFSFKYVEPKVKAFSRKVLQVQDMPSISIRSELKEQKVLQLDIMPDSNEAKEININRSNVSVVAITHDKLPKSIPVKPVKSESVNVQQANSKDPPMRKVSKMSTCDSSGTSVNIDSDTRTVQNTQRRIKSCMKNSPKISASERIKKTTTVKKDLEKRQRLNLDEWKKKLNVVYGSKNTKKSKTLTKTSPNKSNVTKRPATLNNLDYIPYSHLTLGGVRVSDIEREISDVPNKTDMPLSPILDKILSSRENSFYKDSPRKPHKEDNNNVILTTSDENLLREVIDIEESVSRTLSEARKKKYIKPAESPQDISSESDNEDKENNSYADDFEDEKSDQSTKSGKNEIPGGGTENSVEINYDEKDATSSDNDDNVSITEPKAGPSNVKNITYTKTTNLSFKDSVDIFEFVHSVDTHDTATQSNGSIKITPKETQTSPRNDRPNIQPIHNDLWPAVDPRREVEKMFELEKDFIKRLIIDEYGDLLEKNINKPSTSNENTQEETMKNVTVLPKNTQTSPAHVKSVMTSPKKTKTRTTSPFLLSVPVHQQTSPVVVVTNEQEQIVDVTVEVDDISVNLSSPRFSLRLPQNSREVLSNLGEQSASPSHSVRKQALNNRTFTKTSVSTSSSVNADSSSDISSLGEVKIRRKLKKRVPSISEYSSSSTVSKDSYDLHSAGILPLRSEGEISLGQISRKKIQKRTKSDGETSFSRN